MAAYGNCLLLVVLMSVSAKCRVLYEHHFESDNALVAKSDIAAEAISEYQPWSPSERVYREINGDFNNEFPVDLTTTSMTTIDATTTTMPEQVPFVATTTTMPEQVPFVATTTTMPEQVPFVAKTTMEAPVGATAATTSTTEQAPVVTTTTTTTTTTAEQVPADASTSISVSRSSLEPSLTRTNSFVELSLTGTSSPTTESSVPYSKSSSTDSIPEVQSDDDVIEEEGACPKINGVFPVFLSSPTDPTIFFICNWGKAFEFKCPTGLFFNPKISVCDWPFNVEI